MAIAETLVAKPPPLEWQEGGQLLRIKGTRIPLDTIVLLYNRGDTVREIMHSYDTLMEEDVHAVISYYLANRAEVDAYVARRAYEAEDIRSDIEVKAPWSEFRDGLLTRRAERG